MLALEKHLVPMGWRYIARLKKAAGKDIPSRFAWKQDGSDASRQRLRIKPLKATAAEILKLTKDGGLAALRHYGAFLRTQKGARLIEKNPKLKRFMEPTLWQLYANERAIEAKARRTSIPDVDDRCQRVEYALKQIGFAAKARTGRPPRFLRDAVKVTPLKLASDHAVFSIRGADADRLAEAIADYAPRLVVTRQVDEPTKLRIECPTWTDFKEMRTALRHYLAA